MAVGDPTLTNHGIYNLSGSALKSAVDAISAVHPVLSGGAVYLLPVGYGQVQVIDIKYEGTG